MTTDPNTSGYGEGWDDLEAELDVKEERWDPKPGDRLIGTIDRLDPMPATKGEPYYIVHIKTRDGEKLSFPASRARLRNPLAAAKAQPGDRVGIQYDGEQIAEKSGNSFHEYRVIVKATGPRRDGDYFLLVPKVDPILLPPDLDSDPDDAPDWAKSEPPPDPWG